MKTVAKIMVIVFAGALIAGAVSAQFDKPEDAIKYRKSTMALIVYHFKRMGAAVQGKAPYDREAFAANAEVVKMSPAVFSNTGQFKEVAGKFEAATAKLAETAKGADFDAIKAQFGVVAGYCSACHKPFRK